MKKISWSRLFALTLFGIVSRPTGAQSIYTAYAFTNFAGQPGISGSADGTGDAAQFDVPHGVAVDTAGNVYVADTFNNTVREITPAGEVITVAGTPGNHGYVDGVGTAEPARFYSPIGAAVDSAGNLYVGDTLNQTIRKITPGGTVRTLAGLAGLTGHADGTGSAARFHNPEGTAVDSAGNLYVADNVNRTIREITPGGIVTTLAGSPGVQGTNDGVGGNALFEQPVGVAVDSDGNVYVVDLGGYTVRKIAPGGVVSTLAGYGGQSGTNDGVGSAARFMGPKGVAVDKAGNLYVTDSANTIRKVTPGGMVTTLAGAAQQSGSADGTNGAARFHAPNGIAVDSNTNIYVADQANSTIRKLVLEGTNCVVTTLAGSAGQNGSVDGAGSAARFHFPYGLAVDSAGIIYAVDRNNDDIRRITPNGVVTTIAGAPGQSGSADGKGAAAQFYGPEDLTVDDAGNIYVVEFFNNTVRKIAPSGADWIVTTVAGCATCPAGTNDGTGTAARFHGAFGLTRDPSGDLYVADTGNFTVRKLTPSGPDWLVTTLAGAPGQQGSVDGTGHNARLSDPTSLAADSTGNLYLVDGNAIREISPGAAVTTLAGCPPPSCVDSLGSADGVGSMARFNAPRGIAVDHAGDLFVADAGNDTIRELMFSGTDWMVTTLAGVPGQAGGDDGAGSDARFYQPTGVAVDRAGNVYVADSQEDRITKGVVVGTVLRFDASAGSLTVSNGQLEIGLIGPSGTNVVVEASTNLVDWSPIQTNGLPLDLSVPLRASPYRFFRAHLAP